MENFVLALHSMARAGRSFSTNVSLFNDRNGRYTRIFYVGFSPVEFDEDSPDGGMVWAGEDPWATCLDYWRKYAHSVGMRYGEDMPQMGTSLHRRQKSLLS